MIFAADQPAVGRLPGCCSEPSQMAWACFMSPMRQKACARPANNSPLLGKQFQPFAAPKLGLGIFLQVHQHLDLANPTGHQRTVQFQPANSIAAQPHRARCGGIRRPCSSSGRRRAKRIAARRIGRRAVAGVEFQLVESCHQACPVQRTAPNRHSGCCASRRAGNLLPRYDIDDPPQCPVAERGHWAK